MSYRDHETFTKNKEYIYSSEKNLNEFNSSNIIDINEQMLKRLIDKNNSIREFGDRYEYCIIKEYENRYEGSICDSIEFDDCFIQILTVKGEHKLVSIDFSKDLFNSINEVLLYLELYGIKLLKDGERYVSGASEVLQAKKFNGSPIIIYKRGSDKIEIDRDNLVEITEIFIKEEKRINTSTSKIRDTIKPISKIVLNGQEIDYMPEISINPANDLIICNGNIMVAKYIGDYMGVMGFYGEEGDSLPISWIYDKETMIYIDIHGGEGDKIISIDYNYAIDLENIK